MRQGTFAAVALGVLLAASPLLAQGDTAPGASPQPSAQAGQANPDPAPAGQPADTQHVTGTIVSISDTSLDVKVESATGSTSSASTGMAGTTVSFALSAATNMPTGLRAGDRVSVWFGESDGTRAANRVVLATAAASESQSSTEASGQESAPASSASEQSTASATGTTGQPSPLQAQSTAATAPGSKHLPKTASPLPLIGLIGLATLAMAVVMRFALRSS